MGDARNEEKTGGHELDEIKVRVDQPSLSSSTESRGKNKKSKEKAPTVSYGSLYRYADFLDVIFIIIGSISGAVHGTGFPLLFLFFGDLTDLFTEYGKYKGCKFDFLTCNQSGVFNGTEEEFEPIAKKAKDLEGSAIEFVYYFVYIACAVFVTATLQVSCFCYQAARQSKRIRVQYFRSILRQDIAYHDVTSAGELNARMSDDVKKIQSGMADKVSLMIQYSCMVVAGVVIALVYSWKLALVALSIAPLLGVASALIFTLSSSYTKKELNAYASAGSIAQETISSIRTVFAFGIQEHQHKRYSSNLGNAKVMGIKKGIVSGSSLGFLYLSMFAMYALTFWYGVKLVLDPNDPLTPGDMMVVFFNVLIAAFALGTAGANLEYFSAAMAAGHKIFEVIDRVPTIDVFSDKGEKPGSASGEICFKDVGFFYPSRKDVQVLNEVNLTVNKGETVALVGQSGCGKSTCVKLIQRFYDTTSGSVEIDGIDVRKLNIKWLRNEIGVVSQEPILFDTTITENIRWGKEGATDEEIIHAAKQANAYDFISALPQKFDTLVGESGGQMSGGQKQRIAIARAIVRDPKIMLLDEATSALDTESESIVQAALEKAAAGRTTIVIAHRLSTVRNANKIVAFHEGQVVEVGTHDELVNNKEGVYHNLVKMQTVNAKKKGDSKETQNELSPFQPSLFHRVSSRKSRRQYDSSVDVSAQQDGLEVTEQRDEEGDKNLPDAPVKRIFLLNRPEWGYIFFGCIFAGVAGAVDPLNAIVFSRVLTIFTIGDDEEKERRSLLYAMLFLALGVAAFIGYTFESIFFSKSGMELTTRLRKLAFHSIMRQDIAYFDDHKHSTGALCTRLATDASRVQGCTGVRLGTILKNTCSLGVALGIAFAYGWKLTLVTLAFVPFLALGGFMEMTLLIGQAEKEKEAYDETGRLASEAIRNIGTVASLGREETFFKLFKERLLGPARNTNRKALYTGLGYGFSQCVIYFAYAGVFRYGIELLLTNEMEFQEIFIVLTAVIFGAMAVGQNSSFAPDYAEAKVSASRMFALFDTKPAIDAYSTDGVKPESCKGELEFKSVKFSYPTRQDALVLKGCDFKVPSGGTLALVGQSGCGKSTCIQLLERFYDVTEGEVLIDGCDIKELNISWTRQQMGIVSQEPILFDQTIKENILCGDITRDFSHQDVEKAAMDANIHSFITSLPQGYETKVGPKGGQLSGGQKQRVAIARALLRNPKILLLDEATSALDTESEKIVQDALDKAREGRTSIIIAHRLSTVKNADTIAVVHNGKIVETGSHEELLNKRRSYYSLVNAQLTHFEDS